MSLPAGHGFARGRREAGREAAHEGQQFPVDNTLQQPAATTWPKAMSKGRQQMPRKSRKGTLATSLLGTAGNSNALAKGHGRGRRQGPRGPPQRATSPRLPCGTTRRMTAMPLVPSPRFFPACSLPSLHTRPPRQSPDTCPWNVRACKRMAVQQQSW